MNRRDWKGLVALLAGAALCGCPGHDMLPPDVVARIDRTDVPYARFELYLRANAGPSPAGLSSEVLSRLFDRFLEEELLATLASERGFAKDGGSMAAASHAMIAAELPATISGERVAAYYRDHLQDFEVEERVLLRQILVEDRQAAEEAREELAAGAAFDEIVRRYSRGPGAEQGGFQGELTRSDLPLRFAEVIFALREGQVSEVVAADYGFHLFQVVERYPAETLEAEEVVAEIERRLRAELRSEAIMRLVDVARSRYNVEVYERNLPFNYAGRY